MNVTNEGYPKEVLGELNKLRKRAELTDVVLEVEGRSFPCHRAVLASCSPYFRTMFTSGYAEVKQESIIIKDVSEVAMATILDYAYTCCLQMEPDQVQTVMSAARLLQVDFVYNKASKYMKDKLDMSNCVEMLMYADMLGDLTLQEASRRFIASRINQMSLQPSFLQLSLAQLQPLLNRDDLISRSEDSIVQVALRWIKFDQEERVQHLPALCRCFRHSFISADQLVELESKCPSTDSKLVYSDSTTQRLGQTGTEMQIFLRENTPNVNFHCHTPCYDPSTGMSYTMNLPLTRDGFSVAVTPDDELYLAGRAYVRDASKSEHDFFQYNHLLNSWESRCGMITPKTSCVLVYLNGYLYAIGGDNMYQTAERYDPSCDEWTSIAPMPSPISSESELCAVTLDDSIYIISNEGCYSFSTIENRWRKTKDMNEPPNMPQAVTYKGCIYCMDRSDLCYVEKYNPTNDTWECLGEYMPPEYDDAILMLYEGSLYLLVIHSKGAFCGFYVRPRWSAVKKYDLFQYQEETKSWQKSESTGMIATPITQFLDVNANTVCVVAKMIKTCLDRPESNKHLEVPSSEEDNDSDE